MKAIIFVQVNLSLMIIVALLKCSDMKNPTAAEKYRPLLAFVTFTPLPAFMPSETVPQQ